MCARRASARAHTGKALWREIPRWELGAIELVTSHTSSCLRHLSLVADSVTLDWRLTRASPWPPRDAARWRCAASRRYSKPRARRPGGLVVLARCQLVVAALRSRLRAGTWVPGGHPLHAERSRCPKRASSASQLARWNLACSETSSKRQSRPSAPAHRDGRWLALGCAAL